MFATTRSHVFSIKDKNIEDSIHKLKRLGLTDCQIVAFVNIELKAMKKNVGSQKNQEKEKMNKNLVKIQPNSHKNKKNPRAVRVRWE